MDVGNPNFRFTHLNKHGEEEKDGKPIRQVAQAELVISSLDRFHDKPGGATPYTQQATTQLLGSIVGAYSPANSFTVSVPRNLLYGYFHRLTPTQIQIQYRLPTVLAGYNDKFILAKNGSAGTVDIITIPAGYYTPASLGTALQVAIRASPAGTAGYTVNFTTLTGGFLFATNTADTTSLIIPNFPPNVSTEAQAQVYLKAAKLLGAGKEAYGIQSESSNVINPQTSFNTYSPSFVVTDWIDIVSHKLCKFKRVKDNASTDAGLQDVIARVYLNPPNTRNPSTNPVTPVNLTVDFYTPNSCRWSPEEALQDIDFELYDCYGNLLPWTTSYNTEFQLTLLASEQ